MSLRVTCISVSGPHAGQKLWLASNQQITIGRTEAADHVFPRDQEMSSKHVRLKCTADTVAICDLNSTNGTFVNDVQIIEKTLQNGDEFRVGTTRFQVQIADARRRTATKTASTPAASEVRSALPIDSVPADLNGHPETLAPHPPPHDTPAPEGIAEAGSPVSMPTAQSSGPPETRDSIATPAENVPAEPVPRSLPPNARLSLDVQHVDGTHTTIWIQAGQVLTVGRDESSDVAIGMDQALEEKHFLINAGEKCMLFDLGTQAGTTLNGATVQQHQIDDGDEIIAGRTVFKVHLTGSPPTQEKPAPSIPTTGTYMTRHCDTGLRMYFAGADCPSFLELIAKLTPDAPLYWVVDHARFGGTPPHEPNYLYSWLPQADQTNTPIIINGSGTPGPIPIVGEAASANATFGVQATADEAELVEHLRRIAHGQCHENAEPDPNLMFPECAFGDLPPRIASAGKPYIDFIYSKITVLLFPQNGGVDWVILTADEYDTSLSRLGLGPRR